MNYSPSSEGLVKLRTPDEVAAAIGMSPRWVKDAARAGRIPCVRVGRSYRFRDEQIADLLGQAVTAGPQRAPGVPGPRRGPGRPWTETVS